MRVHRSLVVSGVAMATLAAAGCDPGANPPPATYHELEVAISQADCEAYLRCCGLTCPAAYDSSFNRSLIDSQQMIDDGTLSYDPNAGADCVLAYRAQLMDCDAPANAVGQLPDSCSLFLVGTTADGYACGSSEECLAGSYCGPNGSCQTYAQNGDNCAGGTECVSGTACSYQSGTCQALAEQGQDCTGLPCDQSGAPLVCGSGNTCEFLLSQGLPCTDGTMCASGVCSGLPTTCQPPPFASTLRGMLCASP